MISDIPFGKNGINDCPAPPFQTGNCSKSMLIALEDCRSPAHHDSPTSGFAHDFIPTATIPSTAAIPRSS